MQRAAALVLLSPLSSKWWRDIFYSLCLQARPFLFVALCRALRCCSLHYFFFQSYSPTRLKQVQQIWRQTVKVLALSHSFFWLFVVVRNFSLAAKHRIGGRAFCPWEQSNSKMESPVLAKLWFNFFSRLQLNREKEKKLSVNFFCKFWQRQIAWLLFLPSSSSRPFILICKDLEEKLVW